MSDVEQAMGWVQDNGLALYGAVVGTLALGVSFIRVRHLVKRDAIRLKVSARRHENFEKNPDYIRNTVGLSPQQAEDRLAIYIVSVTNMGSVPAHLMAAGVAVNKEKMPADIYVDEAEIAPKATRSFLVCIKRGEPIFTPDHCYAMDGVGREWKSRMKL